MVRVYIIRLVYRIRIIWNYACQPCHIHLPYELLLLMFIPHGSDNVIPQWFSYACYNGLSSPSASFVGACIYITVIWIFLESNRHRAITILSHTGCQLSRAFANLFLIYVIMSSPLRCWTPFFIRGCQNLKEHLYLRNCLLILLQKNMFIIIIIIIISWVILFAIVFSRRDRVLTRSYYITIVSVKSELQPLYENKGSKQPC